jgi:hypothetical protein
MTEQDILHAKLNMWLQLKMAYLQDVELHGANGYLLEEFLS